MDTSPPQRTTLRLHLHGETVTRTIHPAEDPADLAQEIHRHARGILGARQVDVHLNDDRTSGHIHSSGAHAGTFTLEARPDATPNHDQPRPVGNLRHGYTLADLDDFARIATQRRSSYVVCDIEELHAAAWHAAAELLYTSDDPPTRHELIGAAWKAFDRLFQDIARHHGAPLPRGDNYQYRTDRRMWHAYWQTICRHTSSPEEPVVERLALAQIWPRLIPPEQDALLALAAHDDYQAAAEALGIRLTTLYSRVARARARALALWWEGETPRRGWKDRRRRVPQQQFRSVSAHIRKRKRDRQKAKAAA